MPHPEELIDWSDPAIAAFLKHVKSQCKTHNVKLSLKKTKFVKADRIQCGGYFLGEEKTGALTVAMNRQDSLLLLVHEFSHLVQWRDQTPAWVKDDRNSDEIDRWLGGEDIPQIKRLIAITRDMELECEKGAVRLIEEFRLPVDIPMYIRRANAYVLWYNRLMVTRKWSIPAKAAYRQKQIVEAMPSTFSCNYSKLSRKQEELFIESGL